MSTMITPPEQSSILIRQVRTTEDVKTFVGCLDAYMEWLNEDVSFQNYDEEKKSLPGAYVAPFGALLLAVDSKTDNVLGCIAIRPLEIDPKYAVRLVGEKSCCEIKRLFVYPAARGRQVARLLIRESMARVRGVEYDYVFLDSLPKMTAALALYKSEGFEEISPYYHSPIPGTVYWRKCLH